MEQINSADYDKIMDFIIEYGNYLTDDEKRHLLNYIKRSHSKGKMLPDLVREVYDYLGILQDEDNVYLGFLDLLDNKFQYKEKSIIEVAGGIFPCLANRISKNQTTGKIKVYDPRLIKINDTSKMTLIRDKFYGSTKTGDANLLIGFMPCEATYNIIDSATKNNIDFMIALCEGGAHGDIYDYFENEQDWLNTIIYMAERGVEDYNMGTLEMSYLDKYYDPYPIIYNKRK